MVNQEKKMLDKKSWKKVATIEARMTSSRLPGKIMMSLAGRPSLEQIVDRVRRAKHVDQVVIATTTNWQDDAVEKWARAYGVSIYRGSEDDVLLRVLEAQRAFKGEIVVELTGDCPFLDPGIIDEVVRFYVEHDYNYVSNSKVRSYPLGFDVKVFSLADLEEVNRISQDPADREHVSLYLYEHPEKFSAHTLMAPPELHRPQMRICVDTPEDFAVAESIYNALYPKKPDFNAHDIVRYLESHPEVLKINATVQQRPARMQTGSGSH